MSAEKNLGKGLGAITRTLEIAGSSSFGKIQFHRFFHAPAHSLQRRDRSRQRHRRGVTKRMRFRSHLARLVGAAFIFALIHAHADEPRYFGIRMVDAQTGRGVPLVELRTVSHITYIT